MTERLFLFPETTETNPSSFLQSAILTGGNAFKVDGYKLYAFIDRLDEVGFQFCVAPVPKPGESVFLYQFRFTGDIPDFAALGLATKQTENGEVIYLKAESFLSISSRYRSISIKTGHWQDVASTFHEMAAFVHLDLISSVSNTLLRDTDSLSPLIEKFHELYDISKTIQTTLPSLYSEVLSLLQFFGFADQDTYSSSDGNSYYFGALRGAIGAFHRKCFPSMPIGKCCVSPVIVRQLRAMMRFVRASLSRLGYSVGNETNNVINAMNSFQEAYGINEKICGEKTMKQIWTQLLALSTEPVETLETVGVSVDIHTDSVKERFGRIDETDCDEAGVWIARGLSEIVKPMISPRSVIATAQKKLLETARDGAVHFNRVNENVATLGNNIKNVMKTASEVQDEAIKTASRAEASLAIIDELTELNNETREEIKKVKLRMQREVSRTNTLVIALVVLVLVALIQWISRKGIDAGTIITNKAKMLLNEPKSDL